MKWISPYRKRNILRLSIIFSFICTMTIWKFNRPRKEMPVEMDAIKQSKSGVIQYTLASLDQVINSLLDLDLQRALTNYYTQHKQIPENTTSMRIIIASTWRSGSTLLGEILASFPGVFYHYEPLMMYGMVQIGSGYLKEDSQKIIQNLLQCNYSQEEEYLKFAFSNSDLFKRNQQLWGMCSSMPRFKCYIADHLNRICSVFPVHLMKVVRLRLEVLRDQLSDINTRVIWLVRDPRAIISSRKSNVDWCTGDCLDPYKLCTDVNKDYKAYLRIKHEFPKQISLVRYEDIAHNPFEMSRNILEINGLFMHKYVEKYLQEHITSEFDAPWSTMHDPQKRIGRWMKITPWKTIIQTQHACRSEMVHLGYVPFQSRRDLQSPYTIKPLMQ